MTKLFPDSPHVGEPMPASYPDQSIRDFLALRRSAGKRTLSEPGPDDATLREILHTATRVPDHRRLAPWRFLVFRGADRDAFNAAAVDVQAREDPDATDAMLADTAGLLSRAPVVVAVVSSPDPNHKTPVWEQELSAGALCFNLLLSASSSGWAGCWLSEWISFSPGINRLLGLRDTERLAGFVYLGTAAALPQERMRPDPDALISCWTPEGLHAL